MNKCHFCGAENTKVNLRKIARDLMGSVAWALEMCCDVCHEKNTIKPYNNDEDRNAGNDQWRDEAMAKAKAILRQEMFLLGMIPSCNCTVWGDRVDEEALIYLTDSTLTVVPSLESIVIHIGSPTTPPEVSKKADVFIPYRASVGMVEDLVLEALTAYERNTELIPM